MSPRMYRNALLSLENLVSKTKNEVEKEELNKKPTDKFIHIDHNYAKDAVFCQLCQVPCESKALLDLHHKMIHEGKRSLDEKIQWTCPFCLEMYNQGKIYKHVKHCENAYKKVDKGCPECGKKFGKFRKKFDSQSIKKSTAWIISQHIQRMHTKKCEICVKSFENRREFQEHMDNLHKETYCRFCCKYFSLEDFEKHNIMKHFCNICQKRTYNLMSHMSQGHKYSCDKCGMLFSSAYRKQIHILEIHEKKFDYQCSSCKKKFCLKGQLSSHMKQNSKCRLRAKSLAKEKDLLYCEYCSKEFTMPFKYVKSNLTTFTTRYVGGKKDSLIWERHSIFAHF